MESQIRQRGRRKAGLLIDTSFKHSTIQRRTDNREIVPCLCVISIRYCTLVFFDSQVEKERLSKQIGGFCHPSAVCEKSLRCYKIFPRFERLAERRNSPRGALRPLHERNDTLRKSYSSQSVYSQSVAVSQKCAGTGETIVGMPTS